MSERIPSDEFVAILQETFARGQQLTFTPSGSSMLPMLDGKTDAVTFSPKPPHLKKYDVALYRRPKTGQLVLHRMVGFDKSGGYIFSGDYQYSYEYGIGEEDIVALMTAFTRKGKPHTPADLSYRFYIRRMMCRKRLRILASKIKRMLKSLVRPNKD